MMYVLLRLDIRYIRKIYVSNSNSNYIYHAFNSKSIYTVNIQKINHFFNEYYDVIITKMLKKPLEFQDINLMVRL